MKFIQNTISCITHLKKTLLQTERVPQSFRRFLCIKTRLHGFTLIELVVVITILAILSTIGFLTYGVYSSNARDSARKGDISNISHLLDVSLGLSGRYPMPDNAFGITYAGGAIWNQGTIGNKVTQSFRSSINGEGLNKKPVDPLRSSEYVYSRLAFGDAYQIKADLENDLSNPIVYIEGNYGGLAAKTVTGGTVYVLAIPSIITSSATTVNENLAVESNALSGTLLFNGRPILGSSTYNPNAQINSGVVFSGAKLPENDISGQITAMVNGLKSAYSGSDIATDLNVANLLAASGNASLTSLGITIITNQLDGKVAMGNVGGGSCAASFTCGTSTVSDADGNTYNTVQVGTQCWMKENLRTTKSPDGSLLISKGSAAHGGGGWNTDQRLYSCPPNTENNGEDCAAAETYGLLYQWSAAMNGSVTPGAQGICPAGWHVPTDEEWKTLIESQATLGCESSAGWQCNGAAQKLAIPSNWQAGSILASATNTSSFTAQPSGFRDLGGNYFNRTKNVYFWSSTQDNASTAWRRTLDHANSSVYRVSEGKSSGFSVRCILGDASATLHVRTDPRWSVFQNTYAVWPTTGNEVDSYTIYRYFNAPYSGTYYFRSSVDNSASIFVDGTLVEGTVNFDQTPNSVAKILSQGSHLLRFDVSNAGDVAGIAVAISNSSGQVIWDTRTFAQGPNGLLEAGGCSVSDGGSGSGSAVCRTSTVSDIEGNIYNTVQIGSQCWMKENLRTTKKPDGTNITKGPTTHNGGGWSSDVGLYSCPPNATNNGEDCAAATTYGMLYQWSAAMNGSTTAGAQGICPAGWRVPTDAEWKTLIEGQATVGCEPGTGWRCEGAALKLAISTNWIGSPLNGATNTSGFSAQPSGYRDPSNNYSSRASYSRFWSSSQVNNLSAMHRDLSNSTSSVYYDPGHKEYGMSLRCIQGEEPPTTFTLSSSSVTAGTNVIISNTCTTPPTSYTSSNTSVATVSGNTITTLSAGTTNITPVGGNCANNSPKTLTVTAPTFTCRTSTVSDIEGNIYNTVQIGSQCWMKENLRTTKKPDGTNITKGPNTHGGGGWSSDVGLYSCPPNATNNGEDCAAATTYGMLYQWSAAMNGSTTAGAQGICPAGWRVPTDAEWKTLIEGQATPGCDSGSNFQCNGASTKLAIGTNWLTGSVLNNATNISGFSVQPSGYRDANSNYTNRTDDTYLWSSLQADSALAWMRQLNYSSSSIYRNIDSKANGYSLRCIQGEEPPTTFTLSSSSVTAGTNVTISNTCTTPPTSYTSSNTSVATVSGNTITTLSAGSTNITPVGGNCTDSAAKTLTVTASSFTCGTSTVSDVQGNTYNTVQIGSQCWMKENLRTTKKPDGTDISKGNATQGGGGWSSDAGLYSCPPNSGSSGEDCPAATTYGMLYQWSAAMNGSTTAGAQGICPTGWHVPTDAEWKTLVEGQGTVGCESSTGWQCSGAAPKLALSTNWVGSPLNTATNTSGFSAQPSGRRFNSTYDGRGSFATLWASSQVDASTAWSRTLTSNMTDVARNNTNPKAYVFSLRCIRN